MPLILILSNNQEPAPISRPPVPVKSRPVTKPQTALASLLPHHPGMQMPTRHLVALALLLAMQNASAAGSTAAARQLAQDALIVDTHIDAPSELPPEWKELGQLTPSGEFDYPRSLMGDRSPDEMYLKRGLPTPKPALIGNVERARQVALSGKTGSKTAITFSGVLDAIERGPVALIPHSPKEAA